VTGIKKKKKRKKAPRGMNRATLMEAKHEKKCTEKKERGIGKPKPRIGRQTRKPRNRTEKSRPRK